MKPFSGFPARARYTGIPALFFSALLPEPPAAGAAP